MPPPTGEILNITSPQELRDLLLTPDETTYATIDNTILDAPIPYPSEPLVNLFQYGTTYHRDDRTDVSYENFTGNYICPRAYPGAAPEILNIHAPFSTRVVTFSCERMGDLPFVPSPVPQSYNEVLLYQKVTAPSPFITPDGKRVFRVSGMYVFAIVQAMPATGPFPGSAMAIDALGPPGYGMQPQYFLPGLVAPPF